MSRGARHTRLRLEEFLLRHTSRFKFFAEAPDSGSRTDILSAILAVEHRTARDDQRWQVATRGAHHQSGSGLVTATKQDDTIYWIATKRLFDVHANQIPIQHGLRPHVGFPVGHARELKRQATSFPYPALHAPAQVPERS